MSRSHDPWEIQVTFRASPPGSDQVVMCYGGKVGPTFPRWYLEIFGVKPFPEAAPGDIVPQELALLYWT